MLVPSIAARIALLTLPVLLYPSFCLAQGRRRFPERVDPQPADEYTVSSRLADPMAYVRPPNHEMRECDGSVVAKGLLPQIKPLMDVQMRDTHCIRAADGYYYLTGSTGQDIWDHNDGIEVWRSPDLHDWEYLGLVWSLERDATWAKQWRRHPKGNPIRSVWAPEIHYVMGNFFLVYSMAPNGLGMLRSTTGKAQGPYVNAFAGPDEPIVPAIDGTLFQDDDGKVYLGYLNSRIALLNEDLSGLAEPWRAITLADPDKTPSHHAAKCVGRGMLDIGHEGANWFKHDGRYYITVADDYEGRYSSIVAMADNIYGPYRRRHEAIPTGGHGGYLRDHDGNWWGTYFGNDSQSPWRERPALVKVEFDSEGLIHPSADQSLPSRRTP